MTDGLRAVWSAKKIIWWANIENWYLFQYEWNVRRGLSSLCTMHLIIFWGFVSSDSIQKEDMILMIEWWFSLRSCVLIISAHQTNFFVKRYCNAMIVNAVLTAYHVIMSISWFELPSCQDLSLSIVYNSLWLVHPSSTKESFVLLMSGYLIVFNRNRIFRIVGHVKPSSHSFLVSLYLSFISSVFKKVWIVFCVLSFISCPP